jgi:hypothetical protein
MNKHSAQLEILKLRELRPIDIATLYGPILRRRRHDELYSESLIQKRQYQSRFHPASFIAVRIIHIPGISIHMPQNTQLVDHERFLALRKTFSHGCSLRWIDIDPCIFMSFGGKSSAQNTGEILQDYLPCTLARQNLTRTFNCTRHRHCFLSLRQGCLT